MRWLVTGSGGMLGTDLVALLREAGHEVTAATRATVDLADPDAVDAAVKGHDVVANCAAWTAVDDAETEEPAAHEANAGIPARLAVSAQRHGSRLVQVSTDYVFDGRATEPYPEDAPLSPLSAYGRTKAAGEDAVRRLAPDHALVVRTAWLYGGHGACFPRTIARLARQRGSVSVVTDQVGQPTWTGDVARLLLGLVEADARAGTYHATSSGRASWFDFAREVVASAGLPRDTVQPTTSEAFPRPAPRPASSVLGHDALASVGVPAIGAWQQRWAVAAPYVLEA